MENIPQQRKLLSALSHGSIFLSSTVISIGVPIAIFIISEDPVVKENAKESLNFHINLYIAAIVFAFLILIAIGIPLLILLGIASFVMPIIAIIRVIENENIPFRYPFIFRFF
ncbi:DUF4870 domain-containing protein [Calothrix sp. UHCC 0171]|uniref:DUF4870 domain-containing protein n=1 Tax=Calothrix sp. UHCC 0171 TaxID=3110245 RepID=UPI002B1F0E38|nr:DUF4870 domain-containing protein [Calothrix sp. UHCC 0171]MEA5569621.1 DUF4870 domain-containing protein [Calothrix sp. UHCC 0171]